MGWFEEEFGWEPDDGDLAGWRQDLEAIIDAAGQARPAGEGLYSWMVG